MPPIEVEVLTTEIRGKEVYGKAQAMATDITVRAQRGDASDDLEQGVVRALELFATVESACTRFDPDSPLMRVNARPDAWQWVPDACFDALYEAARAYRRTGGLFDPRILRDLVGLGYDRSLSFAGREVQVDGPAVLDRAALPQWRPRFRRASRQVLLGPLPVDLGGIAKGLAVRWASAELRHRVPNHLVEAGGDCYCSGSAPEGGPWRVAVEDPRGGASPIAVLDIRDLACATSSTRLRRWRVGDSEVHHILDPRTGRPGGGGLLAVTVVGPDPAEAEVWTKMLFLVGRHDAPELARRQRLAALWVDDDGTVTTSAALEPLVGWSPA
ncbi:MAG: FAD:protein FMN transferase [Acidimicrobiales bacterium]